MANRKSSYFDRKLEEILRQAAAVFCARGYHQASIRDIARSTGVSLAGLYYYFSSKDELLYLIQRHAFETILAAARAALEKVDDPLERLRSFIRLHLEFFLRHPNEMKVLTHEDRSLENAWRREVHAIKKSYYRLCYDQVEALKRTQGLKKLNARLAVLSLFGMMNWIYAWYNPKVDPDAATCARHMTEIFLHGMFGDWASRSDGHAGLRRTKLGNGSRRNTPRKLVRPRRAPASRSRGGSRPAGPSVVAEMIAVTAGARKS